MLGNKDQETDYTKDRGRQILSISRRVIRGSGDTSGWKIMNNKTREVRLNVTHTR